MNEKVPGVERLPATVDTTIAEYVANAAHGSRYGVDWVYHDDRLGYLLTKPIRDPDVFLRALLQGGGEAVAWVSPFDLHSLQVCRNDDHNGYVHAWMRADDTRTIPLYASPSPASEEPT